MTGQIPPKTWRYLGIAGIATAVLLGIVFRFYQVSRSEFFFYDEGLYLNLHRKYLVLMDQMRPFNFNNIFGTLYLFLRLALGEGKALWFFISHLRVLFGGLEMWYFPRLISATSSVLTLVLIFIFAKRFFNSSRAGWISVVLLALLPSHVFYSRLALQETTCTLFFLLGFYFYLFPKGFGVRTFLSSFFFVIAYFLNYRLVIVPLVVLFSGLYFAFALGEKFAFRKYFWHTLIFLLLIFLIGNIDQAQNTITTFSWMYYQSKLAREQFDFLNFFSYPYYLFRLESIFFAFLFFGNTYLLFKKMWAWAFPFSLAVFYMLLFSFAADKGARYFCVMLPFAVMAVTALCEYVWTEKRTAFFSRTAAVLFGVMVLSLLAQSLGVIRFHSDYEAAAKFLKTQSVSPMVVATQRWIMNLYTPEKHVIECPKELSAFVRLYKSGYRYLVLCPQMYISWTLDGKKFTPELVSHLNFIRGHVTPMKTFSHFNEGMLERFVFEHNENLRRSLAFLRRAKAEKFGEIRIYDMKTSIETIAESVLEHNRQIQK